MRGIGLTVCLAVLSVLTSAIPATAVVIFPPPQSAWDQNLLTRQDPNPLQVYSLATPPTIDGIIGAGEWQGATLYQSLSPQNNQLLGVLYAGVLGNYVYFANDWVLNTDPDPANGGGNAWRFGTATGQGPGNVGNGPWYEVYVQEAGSTDNVFARQAANEASLPSAAFVPGAVFGISAGSSFNGANWQYELLMREQPLPYCWGWVWRQLDPSPGDGIWVPGYSGSLHNNAQEVCEPCTLVLFALGAAGLHARRMRRRKSAPRFPQ